MRRGTQNAFGMVLAGLAQLAVAVAATPPTQALPQLRDHRLEVLAIPGGDPDLFETIVTLGSESVALRLHRHSLRSPSARLIVDHGGGFLESVPLPPPRTYRGTIVDEANSAVAASLVDGALTALIVRADGTRWHVEPLSNLLPGAPAGPHASYRAIDVIQGDGVCGNDFFDLATPVRRPKEADAEGGDSEGGIAGTNKYLAEIAFDADFEFFQKNASSLTATLNDIEAVMNQVEFIYDRDVDINYEFTTFVVRTTSDDPYTTSNPGDLLCEFRTKWNAAPESSIQREVAQLFTGKSLIGSTIGIAWTGVVCNQDGNDCGAFNDLAYSLVESKFTGASFNERVALSCHEIGHNWGAPHCDGDGDCHIMCSGLGGCNGLAGANLKFGVNEAADIVAYRNSVTCDLLLPAALTPPFLEQWNSISSTKWVFNNGGITSSAATNEPSASNSLNLDATGSGLYDDDEIRSHVFLLAGMAGTITLSYYTEHKGVESGEQLFIDYFNSSGDWVNVNTIVSDGTSQTNFVFWSHTLPANAKHNQFRIRFRADVTEANDDWYIDNVALEVVPPPVNDECSGALTITESLTSWDNTTATTSLPAAHAFCNESNGQTLVNDLWFKHTAACTGTLTVDTCDLSSLNTRLLVYPGTTCPSASTIPLGCDDDTPGCANGTSSVELEVSAGQVVYIRLGVISGTGTGQLQITCQCEDVDGDGACDAVDGCPNDPLKTAPGTCGCGVPDTDSDGDGVPNCNDGCPNDPLKTAPGTCGCGVPDTDSDGDGVPNCNDSCPNDPLKTAPGTCGCGVPDADSDGDGVLDCIDGCPNDPLKTAPGACGCGVPDTDTDGDGTPDCQESGCDFTFSQQPESIEVTACDDATFSISVSGKGPYSYQWQRNGEPLSDDKRITGSNAATLVISPALLGDAGTYDVLVSVDLRGCRLVASDSATLTVEPVGECTCLQLETDSDGDGISDCADLCPGFDDSIDTDGDGIPDGCDEVPCPADIDGDEIVGGGDLAIVLGSWGACVGCAADLDDDGVVSGADIAIVLGSWGPCLGQ